eukprot:14475849-Alexandrium_andersonii.AAC.1
MVNLRLALDMASTTRLVSLNGLVWDVGKPKVGVVAGCFFSTCLIIAYVKRPMEEFMGRNPNLQVQLMVDDWQ